MALRLAIFGLFVLTFSYFSVPLYRMFCASTGYGGSPITDKKHKRVKDLTAASASSDTSAPQREYRVEFATTTQSKLPWTFQPTQPSVVCKPGQSVLAFFTATNHSSKCVIGVATYNILPDIVSKYFIKVQCFCFDEQRLLPGETVDMPVLFYIDPAIMKDENAKNISTLMLSYVFFKVHEYDLDEELGEEKKGEIEKKLEDLVGPEREKELRQREERERKEKEKEMEKEKKM